MTDETDLTDFGAKTTEGVLPLVYRRAVVWSPTDDSIPVGFIGRDRRRDYTVYTSRRKPFHFYRDGGGYAVSDSILSKIKRAGVSRIVFHTADDSDAYEFAARQYHDGKPVPESELYDPEDPQTYVPLEESRHSWDLDTNPNELFVEPFTNAMDRLSSRSGW